MIIDFSDCAKKNKTYAGANGSKISIIYNNEQYMLKFPPPANKNKELSYSNSCFSEYLGSHIFSLIGIPAQETLLGYYVFKNKEKVVVACKDFTKPGITIQDFASLKNQMIDSLRNGYGTELSDIEFTIENQTSIDSKLISDRFWNMFIVDALIGNWDRHNGNWGFLYDSNTDSISLAPVYDCGSCLYPQADEDIMKSVLIDKNELNLRIYQIPTSAITIKEKRINYFDFISSLNNKSCNEALLNIFPKISLKKIDKLIDNCELLSNLQKDFYKLIIKKRYELILKFSYDKLVSKT